MTTSSQKPTKQRHPKRRWLRRSLLGALIAIPFCTLGLWIAIHRIEWLGPWLADTGRSIVGNDAIAKLEDWAYGLQDRFNVATKGDQAPTARWSVTEPAIVQAAAPNPAPNNYPTFTPKDVGPMLKSFSAPGDGQWIPMIDPRAPAEPAPLYKTLLHPDAKRGWAEVAIVSADLRQIRLHLRAGTLEPMTKIQAAKDHVRTGLIPSEDLPRALAVFNGGFKTTHGNYGMKAEGVLFVEPRGRACSVAMYAGEKLRIASWEAMAATQPDMVWFRQTPACMFEDGVMHKGLTVEENTLWGATLDKDTVIRRSAIGLSNDGQVLFVGISEATTATAIAKAMNFAGAAHVAQLDVNWSYPKCLTIEPKSQGSDELIVKPIVDGFEYTENDYIRKPTTRDFFYLTRPLPEKNAP